MLKTLLLKTVYSTKQPLYQECTRSSLIRAHRCGISVAETIALTASVRHDR